MAYGLSKLRPCASSATQASRNFANCTSPLRWLYILHICEYANRARPCGLTPAVSRAARSEASGGHQPGTGWRRLDHPVRLQWMPAPWRDTTTWLSWVFAAVPKLSVGVTTSRAMACAGGRDGSHAQARQNTRLCQAWNCQRFA